MHKTQSLRNYNCKYLESTRPVHAIVTYRGHKKTISNTQFYTVPFTSMANCDTYNVIATYLHKEHAVKECKRLVNELDVPCVPEEYQLIDISYYAYMMHVPLVVFINSYCDLSDKSEMHEIFYTARYLNHPNDYLRGDRN